MKSEEEADEEDERVQVAPYTETGGSNPQAMLDLEEAAEGKNGKRRLRWSDCDDNEEDRKQ